MLKRLQRKAGKGKGERTLMTIEIKPFDAETDLNALASSIKSNIEHEGIQNWGGSELEPMAFGISKLKMAVVVYDDLMDFVTLSDLINEIHEDDIQSIDVGALSKV